MDPANTELAMMPTVKNRREDKAVILRLDHGLLSRAVHVYLANDLTLSFSTFSEL